ncbi:Holliday junction DNA helicase subunit RuvB [Alkalispirochaeta americana]|uniref:Holliday junction branch migration complex subunit RuvB n=1 Tax=Alkalispirochaeta americana TaxID=159291 RepID=A0A1N6P998_9SPIO|nr:Holliday junction branch migration DNA helicase RuvB [Alkalispirochaeta americana]SIQ00951.1 Holliday junction DNA helicase subunit RuvB [Alkalispirochaeta americana]
MTSNDEHPLRPDFEEQDHRENELRPRLLEDFLGQEQIKANLRVFIQAARERQESLDHVFLSGPPGLGKTTLASIIAHEMGADLRVTAAPALEKPKDLAGILTSLQEGTVFFIDEIHRLKSSLEEMLYVAMEDYEIDWVIGQGPSARTLRVPLPRFTLVGATTRPGMVASPLYTRFGIPVRLDYYTQDELAAIIRRTSSILEIAIREEAVLLLADTCRGTPRVANRLVRRMRDFAQILGEGVITGAVVREGMERLNIDQYGLEEQDRQILRAIVEMYQGGPVGAETLAISVGEELDSLEVFYEPFLIQQGLLQRTARGRIATPRAYAVLGLPGDETGEDQRSLF